MIKHIGNKWILYSKDGSKKLGEYDTEEEAKKREQQIIRIKNMKSKQFKQYQYDTNSDGSVNIRNVEIFIPGRHKGYDYNEEWWQKTINNFQSQKGGGYLPSVIIGHNDGKEEKPAKGFLDNLSMDFGFIKADIVKVPVNIFNDIKDRAYPHRSVEVNPDNNKLNALALLGGTTPHFKLPIMEFGTDEDSVIIDFAAKKTTTIQTLIFAKSKFENKDDAKKWAKEHKFKNGDVDETEDSFRLRQIDPDQFDPKSFRTIDIDKGIKAVIGKKKSEFEEGNLETEMNIEDNVSALRRIFDAMMNKIWDIFYNRDLSADEKKENIKKTASEGASLLANKTNEFKEDNDMSWKKEFTDEGLNQKVNESYKEKFKDDFGMDPEEFKQKQKDEAENAKKSKIKAFADKLKEERNIAAAIIDERIVPLLEALPEEGTVIFKDNGKDITQGFISAFQSLFDELFKLNEEGKLIVDFSEKAKGPGGEKLEDQFKGGTDEDKVHVEARKAAIEKIGNDDSPEYFKEYENQVYQIMDKKK